jgi:hypothetical protein
MTQPEDDAARLARKIAESSVPHLITDKGKQDLYPLAGIDVGRFAAAIETKLRAHLAERDARERMVREAAERAADSVLHYFGDDIAGRSIAVKIRAALSAKSDEQTPTPTE